LPDRKFETRVSSMMMATTPAGFWSDPRIRRRERPPPGLGPVGSAENVDQCSSLVPIRDLETIPDRRRIVGILEARLPPELEVRCRRELVAIASILRCEPSSIISDHGIAELVSGIRSDPSGQANAPRKSSAATTVADWNTNSRFRISRGLNTLPTSRRPHRHHRRPAASDVIGLRFVADRGHDLVVDGIGQVWLTCWAVRHHNKWHATTGADEGWRSGRGPKMARCGCRYAWGSWLAGS